MSSGPRLILLHPDDTILVSAGPVAASDPLLIDGVECPAPEAVPVGHKIARRDLAPGEKVIKYGAAIGSLTATAARGSWVHSHNMKSDYIASHTRDASNNEDS